MTTKLVMKVTEKIKPQSIQIQNLTILLIGQSKRIYFYELLFNGLDDSTKIRSKNW
jgi:hypothetical protein